MMLGKYRCGVCLDRKQQEKLARRFELDKFPYSQGVIRKQTQYEVVRKPNVKQWYGNYYI